jgi:hypothetical protein
MSNERNFTIFFGKGWIFLAEQLVQPIQLRRERVDYFGAKQWARVIHDV